MNTSFMRLLAQRLEHLSWIEVVPEKCRFVEFFDRHGRFLHVGRPEVLGPSARVHLR